MNLSKIAVNKPTTIIIIFALLLGLGIYASLDLPLDLYPEIDPPVLLIFTDYEGVGPEEIEKTVTRPLESTLSNVGNIKDLSSISSEGSSQIIMEFTWGTDMSEAANDVRDKLELIKKYLPENSENPVIFKFDPSMMPIMFITLSGKRTPEELRKIGEDIVEPRLEQVEGVAMASVSGGRERAIRVEILQNRLQAYNLTMTQIAQMLMTQNFQVSAGSITEGNKNYLITTEGEYTNIEEIKNTVIAYKGDTSIQMSGGDPDPSKVILLRDIANVYDGLKKEEDVVYINGVPGVQVMVQKQSDANSVKTSDNIYYKLYGQKNNFLTKMKNARIKKLKAQGKPVTETYKSGALLNELPSDIELEVFYDSTKLIRQSLSQVTGTAISGALLAIVILFLFLRSMKSVIIIGLSIPVSVVLTLLLMYFFGLTLNIMTLAGLALGIGMLVDNSIVILENIYRYREKGAKLHAAAAIGTQEMINAIVSSTLTTICVFAPIAMFRTQLGMYGELFSGLAFTVVFSLTTSLLVAIFLVPVLSSKYLPLESTLEQHLTGLPKLFDDFMNKILTALENAYKNALSFVLKHRFKTIGVILIIFAFSMFLLGIAGFELTPDADQDYVELKFELPPGTKLEETKSIASQFEQIIKKEVKGFKGIISTSGEKSFFGFLGGVQSHKGGIQIMLADDPRDRLLTSSQIESRLRTYFNQFPSVKFEFDHGFSMGSATPIDILVKSDDLDKARTTAKTILELLKNEVPEVTEPIIDLKDGLPQIEIVIDRQKAYALGLNILSIGKEIQANVDGIVSSQFRDGSDEYDILVILDPKDRDEIPDLNNIFVINNYGNRIPLSSIARIPEDTEGPVNIRRENQKRTIHITAGLKNNIEVNGKKQKVHLNKVEMKIRRLIKERIPQEDDLITDFSGDYADLLEYGFKLFIILIISIALVFGIMASLFESFLDPLIIIFTIPLTLIGVALIYFLTGDQLNILTIVGMVVLVGIVVNNGIVLVDYANLLVRRGYKIIEACIEAGRSRLRPILMTTLTTVLGLLPMAFVKVEGSEMSRPIAKTVVGGLTVSTILTLFLIPIIYSLFTQFSHKLKEKGVIKRQKQLEIRREKLKQRDLDLETE